MGDGTGGPPGNFADMLGSFSTQADQMVQAAKEGRFAVSEEMGNAYITALDDYLDAWSRNSRHFDELSRAPELGTSPYSQQVGQHVGLVASGDDQSAKTQLQALHDIVERAKNAINTAMSKYKATEHDNQDSIASIGKGI